MGFTAGEGPFRVRDRTAALILPPLLVLFLATVFVFRIANTTITVDGPSMDPTLKDWDYVLVTKDYREPMRGDIVSISAPDPADEPIVKRVIALPGDTVEVHGDRAYVNGEPEPWTVPYRSEAPVWGPLVVPPGRVWVMGDNRPDSFDSRRFGFVPLSAVRGKALGVYWPPGHVRRLDPPAPRS